MKIICPNCQSALEIAPTPSSQTYACPMCRGTFLVGGAVPVAPAIKTPPAGRGPRSTAGAASESTSMLKFIGGLAIYGAGMVAILLFVVRPLMLKPISPAMAVEEGQTLDSISASIDHQQAGIAKAQAQAETRNQVKLQSTIDTHKLEALARLEVEAADMQRQRPRFADEFARVWFAGDHEAGLALVDVYESLYREAIDSHKNANPADDVRVSGTDFAIERLWEGMMKNRSILAWMGRQGIRDEFDYFLFLLRSQGGAPGGISPQLPGVLAQLQPDSTGTGFWIAPDGWLLTNEHVVRGGGSIHLRLADGTIAPARVVHTSAKDDLALVKAEAANAEYLWFSTGDPALGTKVAALGFPLVTQMGLSLKLTDGVISSRFGERDEESSFQISNAVQPGNSGGPLLYTDPSGVPWVVGVVYKKMSDAQNVNYAIKARVVREFLGTTDDGRRILAVAQPQTVKDGLRHAEKATCLVLVRKQAP